MEMEVVYIFIYCMGYIKHKYNLKYTHHICIQTGSMHGIDQINIVAHTDLQFTYILVLCDFTLYTHQATYSNS